MDLFFIKKLASKLIMPLPVSIILLFAGLLLLLRDSKTKGALLSISGLAILIAFSTPWLPNKLLVDIEQEYKQFDLSQRVEAIVILGCGHSNDGSLPITSQLHSCSLTRTVEGVRLFRHFPNSQIYTSGYGGNEPFSNAEMNKKLAVELGVPAHKVTALSLPKDTRQEAEMLAPHLMGKTFALVTSASHIPRAIYLFNEQGLTPVAAPTEHLSKDESRGPWRNAIPGAYHMVKAERVWYETMGQNWVKFKSWLSSE